MELDRGASTLCAAPRAVVLASRPKSPSRTAAASLGLWWRTLRALEGAAWAFGRYFDENLPPAIGERFRKCSVMARSCRERVLPAAGRHPFAQWVRLLSRTLTAQLWAVSIKRPDQKAKRARL
jgi:hypothetical protein